MIAAVEPTYGIAFLAGLLSILSPCVFPLIPAYAAFLGGTATAPDAAGVAGAGHRRGNILRQGALFVAGFSTVFIAFFYVFAALRFTLLQRQQPLVNAVAGLVVIVFALQMLGLLRIRALMRELRLHVGSGRGHRASFLLGVSFAAGWTPCLGPQLGAIITLASSGTFRGLPFMLVYCAGLAVPFLLIALAEDRMQGTLRRINAKMGLVNAAAGGLLLIFGVLLLTNRLTVLSTLSPQSPFDL